MRASLTLVPDVPQKKGGEEKSHPPHRGHFWHTEADGEQSGGHGAWSHTWASCSGLHELCDLGKQDAISEPLRS